MIQEIVVLVTLATGQQVQTTFLADTMHPSQFRQDTLVGVPDEELVARAKAESDLLLSRVGTERSTVDPWAPRPIQQIARDEIRDSFVGVPDQVRPIDPTGRRFRYYVYHAQIAASIAQSARIVGGQAFLKHIKQSARTYFDWVDLRGIYFAAAEALPETVGMVGARYYIEFEVLPGTPVLDVGFKDPGIFMVPTGGKNFSLPIRITDIGDADREGSAFRHDCERRLQSGKVYITSPTPPLSRERSSGLR